MQQKKISIIVTSAGTASAISVIKALKLQQEVPVHLIAVDLDPTAAGLFLADEHHNVPPASEPGYIPALLKIAAASGAEILIPIYSKEIRLIAENQELLREKGLKTFLPSPGTIELCNDKRAMYAFAEKAGLAVPKVYAAEELAALAEEKLPLFAKPNKGSSSSGAEKITSLARLRELASANNDLVIQDFIDAQEVTVDVFAGADHEPLVVAPRLRLATKSGQSVKGKTLDSKLFRGPVAALCRALQVRGACNVQFFLSGEKLLFIELNPRFAAGGLMLTVKSGANIPLLLVKTLLGMPFGEDSCRTQPGYVMTRYWEEIIFAEEQ